MGGGGEGVEVGEGKGGVEDEAGKCMCEQNLPMCRYASVHGVRVCGLTISVDGQTVVLVVVAFCP